MGNLALLVLVNGSSTDPSSTLRAHLQSEQKSFDLLSFWQGLLASNDEIGLPEKTSAFDGLAIDPEFSEIVVSVMIDNLFIARPQHSGIRQASIVYEALAEGGITRLMLIFPYQELDRVGPVRSARDYFVDFAEEYGGLYLHAGGSPQALEKLYRSDRIIDLDEDDRLTGDTYSFRDLDYHAPHNLFFDLLSVRERAKSLELKTQPALTNWCFSEQLPQPSQDINTLTIDFDHSLESDSTVQFRYDAELKRYLRFYGNGQATPHIDHLEKLQVSPTNILVQVAPSALIDGDEKERISLQNIGSGKAILYQAGGKTEGRWEKRNEEEATIYTDQQGNAFCLNPGQTWIAIVDGEDLVKETP
jgi:hypothetical protein